MSEPIDRPDHYHACSVPECDEAFPCDCVDYGKGDEAEQAAYEETAKCPKHRS